METKHHPSVAHVLQFFEYDHLPPELAEFSKPFHDLAHEMADRLQPNPETTVGLRKLLEAKDCMVRARKCAGIIALVFALFFSAPLSACTGDDIPIPRAPGVPLDLSLVVGHSRAEVQKLIGAEPETAPLHTGDLVLCDRYTGVKIAKNLVVGQMFVNYDDDGIARIVDLVGFPRDIALDKLPEAMASKCKVTFDALGTGTGDRASFQVSVEPPCI